jgi:hypothetical protein
MNQQGRARDGVLLAAGLLGVLGNIVAVVLLADQPAAYRLGGLDAWATQIAEHPRATVASAVTFTVGLLALAVWAITLQSHLTSKLARAGALIAAIGAVGNGFGTLTPLVLVRQVAGTGEAAALVSRALLGLTLTLDALFNLTLGIGLIAISTGLPPEAKRGLRGLAIVAGIASIPVCGQAVFDSAAKLLVISGPLWLVFITWTSLGAWRRDASAAA